MSRRISFFNYFTNDDERWTNTIVVHGQSRALSHIFLIAIYYLHWISSRDTYNWIYIPRVIVSYDTLIWNQSFELSFVNVLVLPILKSTFVLFNVTINATLQYYCYLVWTSADTLKFLVHIIATLKFKTLFSSPDKFKVFRIWSKDFAILNVEHSVPYVYIIWK